MMQFRKWFGLVTTLLLSCLLTVGCSSIISQQSTPIVLGYSSWPGWWPWAIAEQEGLFEANGVNVQLKWFDNYTESLEALAAGTIDGNCQTLNDTLSFGANAAKGEVAVLVNDNSEGNDKIIVNNDIQNIWTLRGKKVALEAGVVDDFLMTLALESVGLSRNDVQVVNMDTESAAKAFAAGQVDGVGAFPPFWDIALKRPGSRELVTSKDFPGAIPDLLVVTQKLINRHPKQVKGLVNTWFDILEFMNQNPERANQILAERAGVSLNDLQKFQSGTRMFSLADNLNAFTPGEDMSHLDFAAQESVSFLINHMLDGALASPSAILDDQFIQTYARKKS
ncbi:MAG: ABC transporter substrate-binding protein [Cyanobacteria bacterium P01_F01_bin.150]